MLDLALLYDVHTLHHQLPPSLLTRQVTHTSSRIQSIVKLLGSSMPGAAQNVPRTSQLTPTTEHHNVPTTDHNNNNSNSTTPFPQTILDTVRDNSQQDLENTLDTSETRKMRSHLICTFLSQVTHNITSRVSGSSTVGVKILLLSKHESTDLFSFLTVTETDSTKNPILASVGFKIFTF